MRTTNVAVVSPSEPTRTSLSRLATDIPGLIVSLQLSSITQLAPPPSGPPIAIVDITRIRPGSINRQYWSLLPPRTRLVLICRPGEPPALRDAVRAGARALILPDPTAQDLRFATEAAALDSVYLSPGLVSTVFGSPDDAPVRLPGREIETLRLAAAGLTNAVISEQMSVSEATVETYLKRIRAKLNASSKAELITRATELGYLTSSTT
ncbi:response regulator transcription factor [Actinoplanes sp. NPDC051494]|uniref:response regulator transcription factor n=1 Tax=Actinoplanes sp. NPDC051494 TaxID=3363907 RepID=UPI00378D4B70